MYSSITDIGCYFIAIGIYYRPSVVRIRNPIIEQSIIEVRETLSIFMNICYV
jgi:hypothetical protein